MRAARAAPIAFSVALRRFSRFSVWNLVLLACGPAHPAIRGNTLSVNSRNERPLIGAAIR